jgi:hypothetical protein
MQFSDVLQHLTNFKLYDTILIVVFPCMLIITQLLFQQNALVFLLLKAQDITIRTFVFVFLAPTRFNPRGSSSGGAMSVPS